MTDLSLCGMSLGKVIPSSSPGYCGICPVSFQEWPIISCCDGLLDECDRVLRWYVTRSNGVTVIIALWGNVMYHQQGSWYAVKMHPAYRSWGQAITNGVLSKKASKMSIKSRYGFAVHILLGSQLCWGHRSQMQKASI